MVSDIISGRYPSGAVVGIKQITAGYAACYRSVKSALDSLVSQGWLVREKKQYRVQDSAGGGTGRTVVLLSTIDRTRSAATLSPRQQELVRACEIHCSRMRLGLEPVQLSRSVPSLEAAGSVRIPAGSGIAGYLVWMGDTGAAALQTILGRLATTGKPVAVLDEVGEITPETPPAAGARTAFFSMANSASAGTAMGRHLLALGHTRIGFLLISRSQRWAENRCAGMRGVFSAVVSSAGVRTFAIDHAGTEVQVGPALRAALDDRVTAVVAENDWMAIRCLSWLDTEGIRPGRDLSVAGFDDTVDAFMHNLTSYNFNCESTAHSMLQHLLGRAMPRHDKKAAIFEVEGFVTARRSTGRPAGTVNIDKVHG